MNQDVEFHIKHGYTWTKLPSNIKQLLGNSQLEYENAVLSYSIRNQVVYKGSLVRHIYKDQKKYYEDLLKYSRENLMLYPYHLSDYMIRGLRVTPYAYYIGMMKDIMSQEKSYDSLPNFTAADCLRLLGIGRNQYIDLMNATKSNRGVSKLFQLKKRVDKNLLPSMVVESVIIEPWWIVKYGLISDEDVKLCKPEEKALLDYLINYFEETKQYKLAGSLDHKSLHGLYRKGFVYLDVPIYESDRIIVPPLEGFVMNRVLGDYFETLLYKIFVSIDEHTSVKELANILEIEMELVQNAVSVYCRLGFAKKKNWDMPPEGLDESWKDISSDKRREEGDLLIDWADFDAQDTEESESQGRTTPIESLTVDSFSPLANSEAANVMVSSTNNVNNFSKRLAFLFDSTLTAFLMMGNLSPGLKNHAVTMFEVGKLSDETLDSFTSELEKVAGNHAEGEARRYFEHAATLKDTILFLRNNKRLNSGCNGSPLGLDLIRCESLLGLDPQVCRRLLNKNYEILISMAPLSNEIRSISSCVPQHLGPAIPEVSSMWFKLFIYSITENGPPTLFLPKGCKVKRLPALFKKYEKAQITTWGHDPSVLSMSNILLTLQDCLCHSAVLVQAYSKSADAGSVVHLPFPFESDSIMSSHPAVKRLSEQIDLNTSCGYVTLLNSTAKFKRTASSNSLDTVTDDDPSCDDLTISCESLNDWCLLDCCFGIPLFNSKLNKEICQKILTKNLLDPKILTGLLESSRKLSLDLLEFIATNQDLSLTADSVSEGSMLPSSMSTDQAIPMPTRILYFNGVRLDDINSTQTNIF